MTTEEITKILNETAYPREAGTSGENRGAEYICSYLKKIGLTPEIQEFSLPMYTTQEEFLMVNGETYPCKAYWGSGENFIVGYIYYLTIFTEEALKKAKGKIVLIDCALSFKLHCSLLDAGVKGIITYSGNAYFENSDSSQREIRFPPKDMKLVPVIDINAKYAIKIAALKNAMAQISVRQTKTIGTSKNIIADIKGKENGLIILSAHYDSTPGSLGAYDNMSGCICLFEVAKTMLITPSFPTIRLLFCGAEERGLLGSEAYCNAYIDTFPEKCLNINLDMLGSIMGKFNAFSCSNQETENYLLDFANKNDFILETVFGIRSSDSNVFADRGIAAVSFARYASATTAPIHTRFDTMQVLSPHRLLEDCRFVAEFTKVVSRNSKFPFPLYIEDKIKQDLQKYFLRDL